MKNKVYKNFLENKDGVDIHLQGDVSKVEYSKKIQSCSVDGGCNCNCTDIKNNIDNIEVLGKDRDIVISLKGKNLDKNKIAQSFEQCNF